MANASDFSELLRLAAIGEKVVALVRGDGPRRGRPKKAATGATGGTVAPATTTNGTDAPKRKRGRPRKIQPIVVESPADEPVDELDEEAV